MIFNNDRIQCIEKGKKYYLYEFLKVEDIGILKESARDKEEFMQKLVEQISIFDKEKINQLSKMDEKSVKIMIIYEEKGDTFVLYVLEKGETKIKICNFAQLQHFFQKLNANGAEGKKSKKLGSSSKKGDQDHYVNHILSEIHGLDFSQEDNGLELTKQLLNDHATNGFDLDLFQYIKSTGEYVFYEFLKRENEYINNIQAHPMRYCWSEDGKRDNKLKYISLWNVKQYFNGRLFLINYSDDLNEKISIIEILQLDEEKGILEEKKYCMTYNVFISWLKDMNTYNKTSNSYLSDFKEVHYDETFMKDFKVENKRKYGKEFIS